MSHLILVIGRGPTFGPDYLSSTVRNNILRKTDRSENNGPRIWPRTKLPSLGCSPRFSKLRPKGLSTRTKIPDQIFKPWTLPFNSGANYIRSISRTTIPIGAGPVIWSGPIIHLYPDSKLRMTLFLHFGPVDLFDFLSSDNLVEVDSNRDDN